MISGMSYEEARNAAVRLLSQSLGKVVRLAGQTAPEPEFPYIYYEMSPCSEPRGLGHFSWSGSEDAACVERRDTVESTITLTAAGRDRARSGASISGDDEALALAQKAQAWLLNEGYTELMLAGLTVVYASGVRAQPELVSQDEERRYWLEARIRWTLLSKREEPAIGAISVRRVK